MLIIVIYEFSIFTFSYLKPHTHKKPYTYMNESVYKFLFNCYKQKSH
jgi:hypothetical protein